MKKLLLIIGLLSYQYSYAQYIPMLEEGNTWNVVHNGWGDPTTTRTLWLGDEIVINSVTYLKLETNLGPEGCVFREEDKKVFSYSIIDNTERVMYDFNLEIGDIWDLFDIDSGCLEVTDWPYFELVVSDKSIQNIAGEDRTVIDFESPWGDPNPIESWIEGIGSTSGFHPHGVGMDGLAELSCFTKDGITYYFNGYTQCIIIGLEEFSKDEIVLYPNPVTNRSILQLPSEATIDRIKILDIHGRILRDELISKDYYTIDVMGYKSGIYFYQVYSENKLLKSDSFILK